MLRGTVKTNTFIEKILCPLSNSTFDDNTSSSILGELICNYLLNFLLYFKTRGFVFLKCSCELLFILSSDEKCEKCAH